MVFRLQRARIFKRVQAKKNSWNQINQFHDILFWPNSIFCNFKNDQKSFSEQGKSLKLPKMQFHEIEYSARRTKKYDCKNYDFHIGITVVLVDLALASQGTFGVNLLISFLSEGIISNVAVQIFKPKKCFFFHFF